MLPARGRHFLPAVLLYHIKCIAYMAAKIEMIFAAAFLYTVTTREMQTHRCLCNASEKMKWGKLQC